MRINHGVFFFQSSKKRKYLDGKVTYVEYVNIGEFSIYELNVRDMFD